ncbi:MAG: glycosyltransferase [Candidatus Shapirobacteria bacterium]
MRQYRIAVLGKWETYISYFLMGSLQGAFLNGGLGIPISIEKNSPNEIWNQLNFFKPHAVLAHTIFDRRPNIGELFEVFRKYRRHGGKVFYHAGDARTEPRYPKAINDIVDYVLLNHWPMIPAYNVWKIPTIHWPYAALAQEEIAKPSALYVCDLGFAGSLENNQHHAPRAKFIQALKSKVSIKIFPTPETGNTRFQTPEFAASAKGCLGFQMGLNMPLYQDVRPFQLCGAGALYFHDKHPSMDKFFKDGIHYVGFERDNVEDFYNKWTYYLNNPEEANKIRKEAFRYCQEHHSYKERMRGIINILEGKEYKLHYI